MTSDTKETRAVQKPEQNTISITSGEGVSLNKYSILKGSFQCITHGNTATEQAKPEEPLHLKR